MARHIKNSAWTVEVSDAYRKGPKQAQALIQAMGRGEIIVTDEAGVPVDLSPPSDRCTVAAPPPFTKDQNGRVVAKPALARAEQPTDGAPYLSDADQRSFDNLKKVYEGLGLEPDKLNEVMCDLSMEFIKRTIR